MAERRTRRTRLTRLQPLIPLGVIWSAGFLVLIGVALQRRVPYDELLLDPNNLAGVPWYTGLVSNLGILGWATATATGFFGAWIARHGDRSAASRMLLEGAVLSTVLLFDDLLQLHVLVGPLFGLPKSVAYLAYLVITAHWVATQRRELGRTRYELLLAAAGAFGLSIGFDQVAGMVAWLGADLRLLIEDAAKFLGVLAWAQFFVMTSGAIVTSIVEELRAAAGSAGDAGDNASTEATTGADTGPVGRRAGDSAQVSDPVPVSSAASSA